MKKIRPSNCIYVASIPGKGRGVFAARRIPAKEIVEECPACIVSHEEGEAVEVVSPGLGQYQFEWNAESEDERFAWVFGFGSLYNHSPQPNIMLERDFQGKALKVIALREIAEDEELTFDYDVPLWFEEVK